MKTEKIRLDLLLVELNLAQSRERAQAYILSGNVLVNDQPIDKPGKLIPRDALIRIRGQDHGFVSRGGLKLEAALDAFKVSVQNRVALDVGASTGGFTDVLLQRGIARVHAVDVGHSQLDWKIRQNPSVHVLEKVNARYLTFDQIGETVGIIVIDVSFISLDKILPALLQFTQEDTDWITLIKPQFEVGKDKVGKGGIVSSLTDRLEAVENITDFAESLGLKRLDLIDSPIEGTHGNKEFLAHWNRR